jgi:hypothetical protein
MYLFYLKRMGFFKHFALIKPIDFIKIHPIVFNITENTKELYCQTQYFNAIQQCATWEGGKCSQSTQLVRKMLYSNNETTCFGL